LDSLHARLAKMVLGVDPIALVKGDDQEGVDVQYKIERYFDSVDKAIHFGESANDAIFLSLRDGVGLQKIMWEYRTRKIKTRKLIPLNDAEGQITNPATGRPFTREAVVTETIVEYDNVAALPVELKDFYLLPSHAYGIERQYAKGVAERVWRRWDELYSRGQAKMYDPI